MDFSKLVLTLSLFFYMQIPNARTKSFVSKENYIFGIDDDNYIFRRGRDAKNENVKGDVKTSETFITDYLTEANKYRKAHGQSALELDWKLAKDAEDYAKELADKTDSTGKPYLKPSWKYMTGETIFASYVDDIDAVKGKDVADNWYSGCQSHNWGDNAFKKESSRFSQLVWKDTKHVGIGKAQSTKEGIVFSVARYFPAGNWAYKSSFAANVFPKDSGSAKCEDVALNAGSKGTKGGSKNTRKITAEDDKKKTTEAPAAGGSGTSGTTTEGPIYEDNATDDEEDASTTAASATGDGRRMGKTMRRRVTTAPPPTTTTPKTVPTTKKVLLKKRNATTTVKPH